MLARQRDRLQALWRRALTQSNHYTLPDRASKYSVRTVSGLGNLSVDDKTRK